MNIAGLLMSRLRKSFPPQFIISSDQGTAPLLQGPVRDHWILIEEVFRQAVGAHVHSQGEQ